ncbi:MAG: hypothetical protein MUE94_01740 [Verrucomicrobia bacterium]|jgi:hypothetical protein|nr:hypothetical protein [Verrucomicrobiota bacterium]
MKTSLIVALALAGAVSVSQAADFAEGVVDYHPGTHPAPGYTNAVAALGEPTRINPWGDAVTPFNPPYSTGDIVSLGEGGSLTIEFHTPVLNHPCNEYGLDFIIYGNSGFIVTNDFNWETFEWIGAPTTDGSLFGANFGTTRVAVSKDGVHFYTLDPARAPTVDQLLPTDPEGDVHTPPPPGLAPEDFAGLTDLEVAGLYSGSAGGAGYDLAWACDAQGRPVRLPQVRFVRIEVLSGRAEVDAVATVFTPPGHAGK